MAWRRPGDKPLSEPMMVSLLTHICVTRPQWVKYLSSLKGGGSLKSTLWIIMIWQNQMLNASIHFHIWQVSRQLSCGDTNMNMIRNTWPVFGNFVNTGNDSGPKEIGLAIPTPVLYVPRAGSSLAPSHWKTSSESYAVSHWLGANRTSAEIMTQFDSPMHAWVANYDDDVA